MQCQWRARTRLRGPPSGGEEIMVEWPLNLKGIELMSTARRDVPQVECRSHASYILD